MEASVFFNTDESTTALHTSPPASEVPVRPIFAPALTEALLTGGRAFRSAFLQTPLRNAARESRLARQHDPDPSVILLRTGFAFRCCELADGKRSILHIFSPTDVAGLDHVMLANPIEEIVAASRVSFHSMPASRVRELIAKDENVAWYAVAQFAEMSARADRVAATIGRLDAQARICVLLLDMHDRLRRNGLISRGTYTLPLTQEQIADHLGLTLVHVNRTLKRLREDRVVVVDRQAVTILDYERLRACATGLPETPELPAVSGMEPR